MHLLCICAWSLRELAVCTVLDAGSVCKMPMCNCVLSTCVFITRGCERVHIYTRMCCAMHKGVGI